MKIVENYDSILYRYDKNSYRNALHKFLLRAVNRCKIVGRRDIFTKENSSQRRRQTSVDFRLPVFEIFASWRGTCTRITRDEASLFPCILGRRCSVQQFITRGFHREENGCLRRWFAKLWHISLVIIYSKMKNIGNAKNRTSIRYKND